MDILFLSQRLPYPPNSGDKIRTFYEIKLMAKRHRITVASLIHASEEKENVNELKRYIPEVITARHNKIISFCGKILAFVTVKPLSLGHFFNPLLHWKVRKRIATLRPEAVFVFSSSMAQYVPSNFSGAKIMDFCDVDCFKWKQMERSNTGFKHKIFHRESLYLAKWERHLARTYHSSCVVTKNESQKLRLLAPGITPQVVENGVDLEGFSNIHRRVVALRICFTGVMNYAPNVEAVTWFVHNIWNDVLNEFPEATFTIVGSKPEKSVRDLERFSGVTVTGFVEDIKPYLARAQVAVIPLKIAMGIQNKVLEAMAARIPVLASPAAAHGLREEARQTITIAKRDKAPFLKSLIEILKNPSQTEIKTDSAYKVLEQFYSWESREEILDKILLEAKIKAG